MAKKKTAAVAAEKATENAIVKIELKNIVTNPNNPRKTFNAADLQELADSIKENGLFQPITVRPVAGEEGKYEIVCGERRYRASELAGIDTIDCVVRNLDDGQAFIAMVIENMQRKDVDPIEEANAINRMVKEFKYKVNDIAKMLGKSPTFVFGRLQLCGTIPEFVEMLHNGELVLAHLVEICKLPEDMQRRLWDVCFTPECRARWKFKWPHINELRDMIKTHVLLQLENAKFSLEDDTFEGCSACAGCPFNTATNATKREDTAHPRCQNRACYLKKTQMQILRDMKNLDPETEVIYTGEAEDSKEILEAAKEIGIVANPLGQRKTVKCPVEPDREDFQEETYYLKRMDVFKHQKALFDLGIEKKNIVPVYELCYSGHLSGELKYIYNVSAEKANVDNIEELNKKQALAMKYNEALINMDESKREAQVEKFRTLVAESKSVDDPISQAEEDVVLALMAKKLPFEFKQKLGLEWLTATDSWAKNMEILHENQNVIVREFIRLSLSDQAVRFAKDLQGLLDAIVNDRFAEKAGEINAALDEEFAKKRENTEKKLNALMSKKEEQPAEEPEDAPVEDDDNNEPENIPESGNNEQENIPAEEAASEPAAEQTEEPASEE